MRRACSDRGSGTVLVVAVVAVVLVLAAGVGLLVRAQSARTGAQTAADLAALAAASSIAAPRGVVLGDRQSQPGAVCGLAGEVARRNGGVLTGCEVGQDGVVQVSVTRGSLAGAATATARAGPRTARR